MKESYERTQLEITEFKSEDVIVTSNEESLLEPHGKYMMPLR